MDEPNALFRWLMFHFAGGDAFYVALLAIVLLTIVPEQKTSAWRWTLLAMLATIWGGLSSPAWSEFSLLIAAALIIFWRMMIHKYGRDSKPATRLMATVRAVCLAFGLLELSATWNFHRASPPQTLCVIADSITAGLNDGEYTWPKRLADKTGITVRDASQPGATLNSALLQADLLEDDKSPLVMEIGGNDLLSGLPAGLFESQLRILCEKVATPGRVVWMCELPLPPGSSWYGSAQRRICRQYRIRLIPKRKLMQLLTTAGATVDSIHLSMQGQEMLEELIRRDTGIAATKAIAGQYFKCEPRSRLAASPPDGSPVRP